MIQEPIRYISEVDNPEDYPEMSINDRCRTCEHGKRIFSRPGYRFSSENIGSYEYKYQSILCSASKFPVCVNGFIKPEEMDLC